MSIINYVGRGKKDKNSLSLHQMSITASLNHFSFCVAQGQTFFCVTLQGMPGITQRRVQLNLFLENWKQRIKTNL